MDFRVCTLASGSSGNAYYVEHDGAALLVDAGLTGKRLLENLRRVGGRPEKVVAVLVTHDHHDHVGCAGVWHRKHGWPLWMTAGTWQRAEHRLGAVAGPRGRLKAGSGLLAGGFRVECHATPHDAAEPVGFVVERGRSRCGILTDLGCCFPELGPLLGTLDGVFLESNYNAARLAANRNYSAALKRRIVSGRGHLENRQTGALLRDHAGERLRAVMLSHLSEQNNDPHLAWTEVSALAGETLRARGATLSVAPRHDPGPWLVF